MAEVKITIKKTLNKSPNPFSPKNEKRGPKIPAGAFYSIIIIIFFVILYFWLGKFLRTEFKNIKGTDQFWQILRGSFSEAKKNSQEAWQEVQERLRKQDQESRPSEIKLEELQHLREKILERTTGSQ